MIEQKIERGDLCVIFWIDIEDDASWTPVEIAEKEQLPLCKSVGWYLNEDDSCVRLAFSVSGTEETKIDVGRTLIPKTVIRNIEKVREDELGCE